MSIFKILDPGAWIPLGSNFAINLKFQNSRHLRHVLNSLLYMFVCLQNLHLTDTFDVFFVHVRGYENYHSVVVDVQSENRTFSTNVNDP